MQLLDLVRRTPLPAPWSEGDNIPWHEPGFSQRMLKEHLSQAHDAASRRTAKIERQVSWIHRQVLQERATRILDLGCGPGLYASRFARLGHTCVGIDYSPASIQYAAEYARQEKLDCLYVQQDIREASFGTGFGLVMLIYGELNVFRPADANRILRKANQALADDGLLLIEPHRQATVRQIGEQGRTWYSSEAGLFSDRPHLCLKESFWDCASATATVRYFVADALTGHVTQHAQSFQAYTDAEYQSMLNECGFDHVEFFPSLTGVQDETSGELMAIVAKKHPHTKTTNLGWNEGE
jgi:SAM-dependent methyltransferase